jgi:hypothetical protein
LINDPEPSSGLVSDPRTKQTVGVRNSIRRSYYHTLDLKTVRTVQLPAGSLEISIDLSNVIDRSNACCDDVIFWDPDGSTGLDPIIKWQDTKYWQPFYPYASIVWSF